MVTPLLSLVNSFLIFSHIIIIIIKSIFNCWRLHYIKLKSGEALKAVCIC